MCVCVCVCACVRACTHTQQLGFLFCAWRCTWMRACVRACVLVCVCVCDSQQPLTHACIPANLCINVVAASVLGGSYMGGRRVSQRATLTMHPGAVGYTLSRTDIYATFETNLRQYRYLLPYVSPWHGISIAVDCMGIKKQVSSFRPSYCVTVCQEPAFPIISIKSPPPPPPPPQKKKINNPKCHAFAEISRVF